MAENKRPLLESFLSNGIFGNGATVPWEGKDFKVEKKISGRAIATTNDGVQTFIEGGLNVTPIGGNFFDTAVQATKIRSYRKMQYFPEVNECIGNIVDDIISSESGELPILVDFKRIDENKLLNESVKEKIKASHEKIMKLMDLDENASDVFRQFYVDGKRAYQIILSENGKGIERLIPLESSSIFRTRMVKTELDTKNGIEFITSEREAFLYDGKSYVNSGSAAKVVEINQAKIIELPFESVAYADSGMYTPDGRGVVGFLEPAVKPANNLNTIEDSSVIYSITRAIDKRAFFIDVGDLPTKSAESVLNQAMQKFKTKLNYNQSTGEIDANKNQVSMVEDYYLARRNGQNVADIQNLEGGKNIGETNHIQYFREKIYVALQIPRSRARDESTMVNIGGSDLGEISRSEYKFNRHKQKISKKFSKLLKKCLMIECIETGIMTNAEWEEIESFISYEYVVDNYIIEQQETQTVSARVELMRSIENYVGKVFSIEYVKKNILRMNDDEIKLMNEQIEAEKNEGLYDEYGENPLQPMAKQEPQEF